MGFCWPCCCNEGVCIDPGYSLADYLDADTGCECAPIAWRLKIPAGTVCDSLNIGGTIFIPFSTSGYWESAEQTQDARTWVWRVVVDSSFLGTVSLIETTSGETILAKWEKSTFSCLCVNLLTNQTIQTCGALGDLCLRPYFPMPDFVPCSTAWPQQPETGWLTDPFSIGTLSADCTSNGGNPADFYTTPTLLESNGTDFCEFTATICTAPTTVNLILTFAYSGPTPTTVTLNINYDDGGLNPRAQYQMNAADFDPRGINVLPKTLVQANPDVFPATMTIYPAPAIDGTLLPLLAHCRTPVGGEGCGTDETACSDFTTFYEEFTVVDSGGMNTWSYTGGGTLTMNGCNGGTPDVPCFSQVISVGGPTLIYCAGATQETLSAESYPLGAQVWIQCSCEAPNCS